MIDDERQSLWAFPRGETMVRSPLFMRFWTWAVLVVAGMTAGDAVRGQDNSATFISRSTAQRHGLHRPWLTQVEIDRSRDRVRSVVYFIPEPLAAGKKGNKGGALEILGKEKKEPAAEGKEEGEEKEGAAGDEKAKEDENQEQEKPDEKAEEGPAEKVEPSPGDKAPRQESSVEDEGTIYVQSRRGVLHAIDARTGRTLWVTQVGSREKPSEAPAANQNYVAVINGTTLYVLNRRDASLEFRKELTDVPSAGIAIGEEWVYVPMISGNIVAYKLPDITLHAAPPTEKPLPGPPKAKDSDDRARKLREIQREDYAVGRVPSMTYSSYAPVTLPPLVTRHRLAWAESRGRVYLAQKDAPVAHNRFDALLPITAPLTYWPSHIFAASRDGYIYAVHEHRGEASWRFSVGEPLLHPPVPMDDAVYAIAETGGMFCLDMANGQRRWWVPGIRDFLAASATRLYVGDNTGALQVLDRKSGAQVGSLRINRLDLHVLNLRTDRVFVGTSSGVLQCLHEINQTEPLIHVLPPDVYESVKPKPEPKAEAPAKEAEKPPPAVKKEPPMKKEPPIKKEKPERPKKEKPNKKKIIE
jgi:outer membrane protein assembly factor BamB